MQQNKNTKKTTTTQIKGKGAVGKKGHAPKGGHSLKPLLTAPHKSRTHVNGTKGVNVLPTDEQFGTFH